MNKNKQNKKAKKPINLEEQNTRLLMQALHGCRQNCAECRQEEAEWEPKIVQKEARHG